MGSVNAKKRRWHARLREMAANKTKRAAVSQLAGNVGLSALQGPRSSAQLAAAHLVAAAAAHQASSGGQAASGSAAGVIGSVPDGSRDSCGQAQQD